MIFRAATPGDAGAIRSVLLAAFPTTGEADLVEALRADGDLLLEWVAEHDGGVVGAIHYSPLRVARAGHDDGSAAALAPVAVLPDHQGTGIGGRLIQTTLVELSEHDLEAAVVLGHPDYYPRFGFSAETAARALIDPFNAGPAFMALPLKTEGLTGARAPAVYARAFGLGG